MQKALMNWSGGKDSAFALYQTGLEKTFEISTLLTTLNQEQSRISMHGVRESLLDHQALQLGLPLVKLRIPEQAGMEQYQQILQLKMQEIRNQGIGHSIFGDIFLEDLRIYRETQLEKVGMMAVFPLWKKNTSTLIRDFLEAGFKSILVCVNQKYLDQSFAGRIIDESFLQDLPKGVDPCGENGEFHSFVFDGPIFREPIAFDLGEVVEKTYPPLSSSPSQQQDGPPPPAEPFRFYFQDLIPH
ncbi:MAG: Dph6-related ATP pyrophosphatase [Chitinophagaceae bacterium]